MTFARSRRATGASVATLAAVLVSSAAACAKTGVQPPDQALEEPPATSRDGTLVFPVPTDAEAAIGKAGLRVLDADEPRVLRMRAHLDVIVDGKPVTVPRGIGVV